MSCQSVWNCHRTIVVNAHRSEGETYRIPSAKLRRAEISSRDIDVVHYRNRSPCNRGFLF